MEGIRQAAAQEPLAFMEQPAMEEALPQTRKDQDPRRIRDERHAEIGLYLETRIATTDQIARRFFAGGKATDETVRKKASRWLCRQRKRKRFPVRGVTMVNRWPQVVYGKPVHPDFIDHEILITTAEDLIGSLFDRHAKAGDANPDGIFERDGCVFAVELDKHSMTSRQLAQKWALFRPWVSDDHYILVICRSKRRLANLMRGAADSVGGSALFTLIKWLRYSRVERPWIDIGGNRTCV